MAQAIGCDICTEEIAAVLQTNLADGETLGIGPNCMASFMLNMAKQGAVMLGDTDKTPLLPLAREVAEAFGVEVAKAPRVRKDAKAPAEAPTAPVQPDETPAAPGGDGEAPAPADETQSDG